MEKESKKFNDKRISDVIDTVDPNHTNAYASLAEYGVNVRIVILDITKEFATKARDVFANIINIPFDFPPDAVTFKMDAATRDNFAFLFNPKLNKNNTADDRDETYIEVTNPAEYAVMIGQDNMARSFWAHREYYQPALQNLLCDSWTIHFDSSEWDTHYLSFHIIDRLHPERQIFIMDEPNLEDVLKHYGMKLPAASMGKNKQGK